MGHETKKFNVRVYGLLIDQNRVLLVDEFVKNSKITKFPGGGLEWGEGPVECLIREFREETGIDVRVERHIYTTDFFQPSAFVPGDQIISIYYRVSPLGLLADNPIEVDQDRLQPNEEILGFHWIDLSQLEVDRVSLPIDKYVVEQILESEGGFIA